MSMSIAFVEPMARKAAQVATFTCHVRSIRLRSHCWIVPSASLPKRPSEFMAAMRTFPLPRDAATVAIAGMDSLSPSWLSARMAFAFTSQNPLSIALRSSGTASLSPVAPKTRQSVAWP